MSQGAGIAVDEGATIPGETRFIITNVQGRTTLAQLPEGTTITTDDIEVSQVGMADNLVNPSNLQIDAKHNGFHISRIRDWFNQ